MTSVAYILWAGDRQMGPWLDKSEVYQPSCTEYTLAVAEYSLPGMDTRWRACGWMKIQISNERSSLCLLS